MNDEKNKMVHDEQKNECCSFYAVPKFLSNYNKIKVKFEPIDDELSYEDKKFGKNAIKNRIINGDCYEVIKSIADNSIDCIYTDIPYLIDMRGSGDSDLSGKLSAIKKDLADISNGIDLCILEEFIRVLKKVNCFIWCSRSQIKDIVNFFSDRNCIVEYMFWGKTNPIPAGHNTWLGDVEYCLHIREKGVILNEGYNLKSKFYISSINKSDKIKYKHPTIKPIELVKRHILHATQKGDLVADFFGGVMTTCVACNETSRDYLGVEISKKWFAIGEDRMKGIDAIGQTSLLLREVDNTSEDMLNE